MEVARLCIVPVKGARLVRVPALELEPGGVLEDRAFFVVQDAGGLASTARTPGLQAVVPHYDRAANTLRLTFPDGSAVEGEVPASGREVGIEHYDGRPNRARVLDGPWTEPLSAHLGRAVHVAARAGDGGGWDDAPVTVGSEASLAAVAAALPEAGGALDGDRFRLTVTVSGAEAWAEDGWCGGRVQVGEAVLEADAPVGRCVVTTRDPQTGRRDHPVLKALAGLRGKDDVCFGVWARVARPGRVEVGDPVRPL